MSELPDYYAVLEVAPGATQEQIRTAYKKAALKWHPDRVPSDSPERPTRTRRFQKINDAYYTLSAADRREAYDEARRWHNGRSGTTSGAWDDEDADEEVPRPPPKASSSSFPWSFFTGTKSQEDKHADAQFEEAFESMMHDDLSEGEGDERKPNGRFWSIVGTLSGAALGFIIANVPGAAAGGAAGNRLGDLRDRKGQSVYATFQQLPQNEKAKILTELAAKLFTGAIS